MGTNPAEIIKLPVEPTETGSLRLALFATGPSDGRAEPFWLLRRTPEASVYLGGLIDATNAVHELLEIWVQRIGGLAAAFPVLAQDWTGADLDRKWSVLRENIAAVDGQTTLRLGIENAPPAPLILNGAVERVAPAADWEPCRDDQTLAAAGLPGYQGSLHRYLRNRATGEWLGLTVDAPLAGVARRFRDAFPDAVCFNPEGGRIFCRPAVAIGWRDYVGCLHGRRWQPQLPDACLSSLPPIYRELISERDEHARWKHFLLPQLGVEAGPAESFYLKLAILYGAVETIASATARQGTPFLNLTGEHFGIRLSDSGDALPGLWSAKVVLLRAGGAASIGGGCHLPESTVTPGPFRIPAPHHSLTRSGSFRVRKVGEVVDGMANVEGTLETGEGWPECDDFRLEIRLEGTRETVVIPGEIELHVSPHILSFVGRVSAEAISALVEGTTLPQTDVILYPKLGPACDLYSLGILGLELFLAKPGLSLSQVADDALRLKHSIPDHATSETLPCILSRLVAPFDAFTTAAANVPEGLWLETLSCLMRMLGGNSPAAYHVGAAGGIGIAPETFYRPVMADLGGLLRRARVRILGQHGRNREVRDEILAMMADLARTS